MKEKIEVKKSVIKEKKTQSFEEEKNISILKIIKKSEIDKKKSLNDPLLKEVTISESSMNGLPRINFPKEFAYKRIVPKKDTSISAEISSKDLSCISNGVNKDFAKECYIVMNDHKEGQYPFRLTDFISKEHSFYYEMGEYFNFLMDAAEYFRKCPKTLRSIGCPFWTKGEIFLKPTIMIIGEKNSGKTSLVSYLLQKSLKDIKENNSKLENNNIFYWKPNDLYVESPYKDFHISMNVKLEEYYKNNFQFKSITENNQFLDIYNVIDCTNCEKLASNDKLSMIYDYFFGRVDVIVIVIDERNFTKILEYVLIKVKKHFQKVIIILNNIDKNVPLNKLIIKKNLIKWYISQQMNISCGINIFCFDYNTKKNFLKNKYNIIMETELKYLEQWLVYHQLSIIYHRYLDVWECCKKAITYSVFLGTILNKKSTFIPVITKTKIAKLQSEAKKLADLYGLPFIEGLVDEKFFDLLPEKYKPILNLPYSFYNHKGFNEIKYFVPYIYEGTFNFLNEIMLNKTLSSKKL
uniref:G domain-containing protein n=1 Tax=Parastrongyloides trichosuri TaxID=131310 RepID=A0A0N5A583_PARTI